MAILSTVVTRRPEATGPINARKDVSPMNKLTRFIHSIFSSGPVVAEPAQTTESHPKKVLKTYYRQLSRGELNCAVSRWQHMTEAERKSSLPNNGPFVMYLKLVDNPTSYSEVAKVCFYQTQVTITMPDRKVYRYSCALASWERKPMNARA